MSEASRGVPLELIHDECWGVPIVIDKNTSVYILSPKVYLGVWPLYGSFNHSLAFRTQRLMVLYQPYNVLCNQIKCVVS